MVFGIRMTPWTLWKSTTLLDWRRQTKSFLRVWILMRVEFICLSIVIVLRVLIFLLEVICFSQKRSPSRPRKNLPILVLILLSTLNLMPLNYLTKIQKFALFVVGPTISLEIGSTGRLN